MTPGGQRACEFPPDPGRGPGDDGTGGGGGRRYRHVAMVAAASRAEAERQSRILRAEGERAARFLQAQGQAKAIETVFQAIHDGNPDPRLLAYQYLQTLPLMAKGEANKVWVVPSDFGKALEGFTKMLGAPGEDGVFRYTPSPDDGAAATRPGGNHDHALLRTRRLFARHPCPTRGDRQAL